MYNCSHLFINSPGTVPPSTLLVSPSGDGHDYETQESWDESPPHECYSHYPTGDAVGSSEDDDDDEDEDDPHYEPVKICEIDYNVIMMCLLFFRPNLCSTMTDEVV